MNLAVHHVPGSKSPGNQGTREDKANSRMRVHFPCPGDYRGLSDGCRGDADRQTDGQHGSLAPEHRGFHAGPTLPVPVCGIRVTGTLTATKV